MSFLLQESGFKLLQESGGSLLLDQAPTQFAGRAAAVFLADIAAYDPGASQVVTYAFASGQGYDHAGTFYAPRIEQPAVFSRAMGGGTGGKATASYGELTLVNNDGALDAMADDYFDGRTLTLRYGDASADPAAFTVLLVATIESVAFERERVSIRLRDRATTLDKPFSEARYAGNNSLPTGVEGTADDLKDQYKPRVFGRIALMQPVLVNTGKLIYQVNAAAVDAILQVYDGGAYLSQVSGDYSDLADMYNNAPASGCWRALPSQGLFRLGSMPVGQVSCSVAESWDYLDNTAAGLIQRILTEIGFTSSDWVADDFTALNQRNAGSLGVLIEGGETTASLIDRVCQSVGAWWGFDSLNRFRVVRFDAPSGSPVVTFTDDTIIEVDRQPESQLPFWEVILRADRNYAVQDKQSLAGVVPADRAAWFSADCRDQKSSNSGVKSSRLLADTVTYDTALNGIATAAAEASRRLALYSARRDVVTLTVANPAAAIIDIGSVVSLATSQFGYGGGRLMTVTSLRVDYQRNLMDITCWG